MFVPVIVIALYMYFATLGLTGSTFSIVVGHTLHGTPFVIVLCMMWSSLSEQFEGEA